MTRVRTLCLVSLIVSSAAPVDAQTIGRMERAAAASNVWSEAKYNYVGWNRLEADWDSAYRSTLLFADRPIGDLDFYRSLRRFTALLGHGNTKILVERSFERRLGEVPLHVLSVDGNAIVTAVKSTSEMKIAKVETGSLIVEVQGVPVARWIRDSVLPETSGSTEQARLQSAFHHMLDGERGTTVHLMLRQPDQSVRGVSVTRSERPERESDRPWWRESRVETSDRDGVRILEITTMSERRTADDFDRALDNDTPDALVVDLRDVHFATPVVAARMLGRLFSEPVVTPDMNTQVYWASGRVLERAETGWTPYATVGDTLQPRDDRPPFTGPVVVLTSPLTRGAAEAFAAIVQRSHRGILVGENTAGTSGAVLRVDMPGPLMFQVAVGEVLLEDGTRITLAGLTPDHLVQPTLEKGDPVLERALELIRGQVTP